MGAARHSQHSQHSQLRLQDKPGTANHLTAAHPDLMAISSQNPTTLMKAHVSTRKHTRLGPLRIRMHRSRTAPGTAMMAVRMLPGEGPGLITCRGCLLEAFADLSDSWEGSSACESFAELGIPFAPCYKRAACRIGKPLALESQIT